MTWREDLSRLVAEAAAQDGPDAVRAALETSLTALTGPVRVEPLRCEVPVLGVDACKAGWVGVLLHEDGRLTVHQAARIAALVEHVRESADVRVVAIDIPIGLPDRGGRAADALARAALPGKSSSVFSTLTRAAYEAPTYAEGREQNLAATDGRTSASAQSYALRSKILDVDAWVRAGAGTAVLEVHPELSFARIAGGPLLESKHEESGRAVRRTALAAVGLTAPAWFSGSGFGEDDLLDACAAVWTAVRFAEGTAESLPAEPEVFSDQIPAAIWV